MLSTDAAELTAYLASPKQNDFLGGPVAMKVGWLYAMIKAMVKFQTA